MTQQHDPNKDNASSWSYLSLCLSIGKDGRPLEPPILLYDNLKFCITKGLPRITTSRLRIHIFMAFSFRKSFVFQGHASAITVLNMKVTHKIKLLNRHIRCFGCQTIMTIFTWMLIKISLILLVYLRFASLLMFESVYVSKFRRGKHGNFRSIRERRRHNVQLTNFLKITKTLFFQMFGHAAFIKQKVRWHSTSYMISNFHFEQQ